MTVITDDIAPLVKAGSQWHLDPRFSRNCRLARHAADAEAIENVGGDLNAAQSSAPAISPRLKEGVPLAADIGRSCPRLCSRAGSTAWQLSSRRSAPRDDRARPVPAGGLSRPAHRRAIPQTVDFGEELSPPIRARMDATMWATRWWSAPQANVDHDMLVRMSQARCAPIPEKASMLAKPRSIGPRAGPRRRSRSLHSDGTLRDPRLGLGGGAVAPTRECAASAIRSMPFLGLRRLAASSRGDLIPVVLDEEKPPRPSPTRKSSVCAIRSAPVS